MPDPLGRGLSDDRSEGPSSFIKKRRRQIGRLARSWGSSLSGWFSRPSPYVNHLIVLVP